MGASWGPLRAGPLGGVWWPRPRNDSFPPPWLPLGPVLGLSWAVLGLSWGRLGALQGCLGGLLGCPGAVVGASWAVFNAVRADKSYMLKMHAFQQEFDDFWPLEAFLGVLLETSWGPLVLSCSRLGHLGAIFGRRGAFLDRLGGLLELSWPVLEPSGLRNSHARNPGSAQERPEAPGSARKCPEAPRSAQAGGGLGP